MSNQKFRILVIGDKNRFVHLEKFLSELQKKNIETKLINDLEDGLEPPQPQKTKGEVIRTNGQDTVLKAPKKDNNDKEYVKLICSSVMKMQFNFEDMSLKDRDHNIIKNLKQMEARGNFE